MKSKFNKLLLSTVFAGLCFGCFTPSLAEGDRLDDREPIEVPAPAPEKVGPKLDEAAPAPVEAKAAKKITVGEAEKESQDGVGLYFYCSYVSPRGTARGSVGGFSLESVLKGACMACLRNGVRSCELDGCTAKDYVTGPDGDKTFDKDSVEREVVFDTKTVNLACPINVNGVRTDSKSELSLGGEVGKKESIAALVPANTEGKSKGGDGSYHYESGGSFESSSNGSFRARQYEFDSQRGGASREIVIPPRPRFWGGGGFYGGPPTVPYDVVPKGKPEVMPRGKGRPEIDRRAPAPEVRPQPQGERRGRPSNENEGDEDPERI